MAAQRLTLGIRPLCPVSLLEPTELVPLGRRPDKAEEMTKQIMWRAGIATTGAVV